MLPINRVIGLSPGSVQRLRPVPVSEQRLDRAIGADAVDFEFCRADHEIDVRLRLPPAASNASSVMASPLSMVNL